MMARRTLAKEDTLRATNCAVLTAIAIACAAQPAIAQNWNEDRADALAPIGLQNTALVETGTITLSYRFLRRAQYGYRTGVDSVVLDDVIAQYAVVPTRLTIAEHLFGFEVGATSGLTFALLIPYSMREMEHTAVSPGYDTETDGIGDLSVAANLRVIDAGRQRFHLTLGAHLPTGSIDEAGPIAGGADARLPYAMQLGSGAAGFRPGFTYQGQNHSVSWGVRFVGTFPVGENDNGYHWGTRGTLDTWIAANWAPWISSSFRATYDRLGSMQGADTALDPAQSPSNDAAHQSRTEIDGWVGINLHVPSGPLRGVRLAIEGGIPMYMMLDGPQLRARQMLNVAVHWSVAVFGDR
jgi:hypothetical protein